MNYIWSSGIRWKMFYRKALKEMEWLDLESNWQAWIGLEKKEKDAYYNICSVDFYNIFLPCCTR